MTDTGARIRAVALDLFSSQGYEQTSLREIADRVGLTKASLYYHYPSKQALLLARRRRWLTRRVRSSRRRSNSRPRPPMYG